MNIPPKRRRNRRSPGRFALPWLLAVATAMVLPLRAISVISAEGKPFHDPAAHKALFSAIREHLYRKIPLVELDCAINDPPFAEACVEALLAHINCLSALRLAHRSSDRRP